MKILTGSACLLAIACLFFACNLKPSVRGNEGSLESKSNSAEEMIVSDQAVDFEGVSFHYDPRIFGDVKKEVVPEHKLEDPTDKPDYVEPKNVRFDFEFGRKSSGANARIVVYPLDEFDDMYSISPDMVKQMNDEIAGLRKVLKEPTSKLRGQIPNLEYADASDTFNVKVSEFDFPSGNGIIFVTHWTGGVEFVSNRNLLYRFEGITTDGKYFVIAETPVSVAFLPDESPDEFEGYTWKDLTESLGNSSAATAKQKKYIESITTRLEKLTSKDYSPNLEKFEAIISSLKIDK